MIPVPVLPERIGRLRERARIVEAERLIRKARRRSLRSLLVLEEALIAAKLAWVV